MKKVVLFFTLFFTVSIFFAQSSGLETSVKINKKIQAYFTENHFIALFDNESDFLITIGVSGEDSAYFYKEKYKNEIKKLVAKINTKSDAGDILKQLTITDAYFCFEYDDDYFLFRRIDDIKLID